MVKRSREDSPVSDRATSADPLECSCSSPMSTDAAAHTPKYKQVDDDSSASPPVIRCSLPPHEPASFSTYEDFDVHYAKVHANRCSECRKNFPTEHFLGLHIGENHDPLNEARRASGEKTYHCLVEGCDKICSSPEKRRMHLVDKHLFPRNYDFFVVNDGIDKRTSMLRNTRGHRRRSSAAARAMQREQQAKWNSFAEKEHKASLPESGIIQQPSVKSEIQPGSNGLGSRVVQDDVADLTNTMSALKFVPPSIRFGRGGRRGGLSRR